MEYLECIIRSKDNSEDKKNKKMETPGVVSEMCSFALGRGPVEYGEAVVSRRKTVKSCREICRVCVVGDDSEWKRLE